MAFSRTLGLLLVSALATGCAHARPASRPAPAGAPAAAATSNSAPTAPDAPATLDPSEEITPEELASIPEPVPPSASAPETSSKPPPEASDAPKPVPVTPSTSTPETAPTAPPPAGPLEWTWRVQILATPDRALADRVARDAADALGTTFRVDLESGLYKVRLGAFASEAAAAELKSRAVEMGYPGAFRVKIHTPKSDG